MKNKLHRDFFDAVDVVCINCLKNSEENCKNCPVRYTCDKLLDIKENEYFVNVCAITKMEYKTTKAFEDSLSAFVKNCSVKRKEILDANEDTAEYCNPLTRDVIIADILCGDDVDENGIYSSFWGVTDKNDSDSPFSCYVCEDNNTVILDMCLCRTE